MLSEDQAWEQLSTADLLRAAFPGSNGERPQRLCVIHQGGQPRWMVLGDARAAAAVLRSWRPFRLKTRIAWAAVCAAASVNQLPRVPGVRAEEVAVDSGLWQSRVPGFCPDWTTVLLVGTPSYTRKVILFFVDDRGHIHGAAKVPLTPAASGAILNEATVLSQLPATLCAPRVLFEDSNLGIAAQTWLEGQPVSRDLTEAHIDLLAELAVPGAAVRVSQFRDSLERDLEGIQQRERREVLARALEVVEDDRLLPAFIEHGDFAPWNLKRLRDGRLALLDWEWAIPRGLPCQDLFRFFYIQDVLFGGNGRVWEALNGHPLVRRYLNRFSIPEPSLAPLAACYLLRALGADAAGRNERLVEYGVRQLEILLRASAARSLPAPTTF